MTKCLQTLVFTVAFLTAFGGLARAQAPPAGQAANATTPRPIVPVRVQIVITRFQGDTKILSLPFTLSLNANDGQSVGMRMGTQVPLIVPSTQPIDNRGQTQVYNSVVYKDVGTSIDCIVNSTDDGRFKAEISIEDSSILEGQVARGTSQLVGVPPNFRSFRTNNTVFLREGQSLPLITASDKFSGEIIKVDVILAVDR